MIEFRKGKCIIVIVMRDIKDISIEMNRDMVRVVIIIVMEIYIMENGIKIRNREKGNYYLVKGVYIKVVGKMIW